MAGIENINAELKITSNRFEAETQNVLIVVYDPMQQEIKVGKGPNKGRKIMNRDLVEEVIKVGEWKGGEAVIPLPKMMKNRFGGLRLCRPDPRVRFLLHLTRM